MDFSRIDTFSIHRRCHKVTREHLGKVPPDSGFAAFYDALPCILGVNDLKTVAQAVAQASLDKREVILAMGAHPVKCGLTPLIIRMMEDGIISCVACNGAVSIHDYELALIGETSEDVAETLQDGSFGMVEETGRAINDAMAAGLERDMGAGKAVGTAIIESSLPHADISVQAAGIRTGVDVTIHIAVGTDTIHVHPNADGAVIGEASHRDFKTLTDHIARLDNGVFINLGSAVILPEVFLKSLSAVRNMKYDVRHFTTVNMDMIRHYRPSENVLKRPGLSGAHPFHITGQHEIMVPLLSAAIYLELERMTNA